MWIEAKGQVPTTPSSECSLTSPNRWNCQMSITSLLSFKNVKSIFATKVKHLPTAWDLILQQAYDPGGGGEIKYRAKIRYYFAAKRRSH